RNFYQRFPPGLRRQVAGIIWPENIPFGGNRNQVFQSIINAGQEGAVVLVTGTVVAVVVPVLVTGTRIFVTLPRINTTHIFPGEINGAGSATGFHHVGNGIWHQSFARIVRITKPPNQLGVYQAEIQIFNHVTRTWVTKARPSTFFPNHWSRRDVLRAVRTAYLDAIRNRHIAPNVNGFWERQRGRLTIRRWVHNGRIHTAYPLYDP
ncbi:MAG TPA: EndoU domain-containing protein, partial [Chthonomonadales bacterium]|nr:EndoU domain-containing protein [Chthonomonadales bacterium]